MILANGGTSATTPYINIKKTDLTFASPLVPRASTTGIILHHIASSSASPQDIHSWYIASGRAGAGYNIYIQKDGTIWELRPIDTIGEHCPGKDFNTVGICFEGDFQSEVMGSAQLIAGENVIAYLYNKYNIPSANHIWQHLAWCDTDCPGINFPFTTMVSAAANLSSNASDKVSASITTESYSTSLTGATTRYGTSEDPSYVSSSYSIYTVAIGDTVATVSKKLGTDISTLKALNGIGSDNVIPPGLKLKYPSNNLVKYLTIADSQSDIATTSAVMAFKYVTTTKTEEAKFILSSNKVVANDAQSTLRGGKTQATWESKSMLLPGYKNATLVINTPTGANQTMEFLIGPSTVSESRSNLIQPNKTSAGWFVYRLGPNLAQIAFTGSMLDSKYAMERHVFLVFYKNYIEDKMTATNEYVNPYTVNLFIEGIQYIGYITSLSFQKSSDRQFLYSYSIQFLILEDKDIFNASTALSSAIADTSNAVAPTPGPTVNVSEKIYVFLTQP